MKNFANNREAVPWTDRPATRSGDELKKLIEEYELQISKNIEILHDLVKNIFPKKYFTITNVEDDGSTFSINVFGCTPDECKMSNYVEVENIIQKYFNNQYFFSIF
jgi:hypothetical protein